MSMHSFINKGYYSTFCPDPFFPSAQCSLQWRGPQEGYADAERSSRAKTTMIRLAKEPSFHGGSYVKRSKFCRDFIQKDWLKSASESC